MDFETFQIPGLFQSLLYGGGALLVFAILGMAIASMTSKTVKNTTEEEKRKADERVKTLKEQYGLGKHDSAYFKNLEANKRKEREKQDKEASSKT